MKLYTTFLAFLITLSPLSAKEAQSTPPFAQLSAEKVTGWNDYVYDLENAKKLISLLTDSTKSFKTAKADCREVPNGSMVALSPSYVAGFSFKTQLKSKLGCALYTFTEKYQILQVSISTGEKINQYWVTQDPKIIEEFSKLAHK